MKIHPKLILSVGTVSGLAILLAAGSLLYNKHTPVLSLPRSAPEKQKVTQAFENEGSNTSPRAARSTLSGLQAILNEQDSARRKELLEQWAKSVDVGAMADTLLQTEAIKDAKLKSEACAALLGSWGVRDLGGEASWFEHRGGADGLHQQAREALAQAMAERDPAGMLDWMQNSMTATGRMELYIPLCQEWVKRDPAGAAELLRQKLGGSAIDPGAQTPDTSNPEWVDMAGQIAAQWSNADVNGAVNWVQSLPPGTARARALAMVGYKWAEINPQAAAAYATTENDPQFTKNVASRWAESNPQAAADWAQGLPSGENGTAAMLSVASVWTQNDPMAAATCAANLSREDIRNKTVIAVVSAWAGNDPAAAKAWVQQFPGGQLREQAMEQIKLADGK